MAKKTPQEQIRENNQAIARLKDQRSKTDGGSDISDIDVEIAGLREWNEELEAELTGEKPE